ncbi:MAG TPA: type II CAAX endopeptidase family protein [Bacteroidota bacterium]|nr:type II CAAX endopeptidase family protein [Bacteroidota bacterium]
MMRTIFYNDKEGSIRAGWRMGMFVLGLGFLTALIQWPLKLLLPGDTLVPGFFKGEVILYGCLLVVAWLFAKLLERRPPLASIGLPFNAGLFRELGQGILIGGGMMTVIFVTEYSLGMVTFSFKPVTLLVEGRLFAVSAVIFAVGGFGEELLFRGYLFQTMIEGTGKLIAVLAFAVFFGLAHLGNPNVTFFSIVNVALAGVWFSVAYFKTKSLWFPIGLHCSWNFVQNHLFSFPVSGISFTKYQLGVLVQSGPTWLTGGTFGPEGGALTTLMLVVSAAFIYWSPWIRPLPSAWTLEGWREAKKSAIPGEPTTEAHL